MKKPSAANTTDKLLEGYTFLVEESLGKGVASSLAQSGFEVVPQGETIPTGISDAELFLIASQRGLVVLSKDSKFQYRQMEKAAIVTYNLAVIQLARGNLSGEEMAAAFIAARRRIASALKMEQRPFVLRINREGSATSIRRRSDLVG